jgi:hypothetical protein
MGELTLMGPFFLQLKKVRHILSREADQLSGRVS